MHATPFPIAKSSISHALKERKALHCITVTKRAFLTWFRQVAAIFTNLLGAKVVYVSLTLLDKGNRPVIELFKIIRGKIKVVPPVESQPTDIILDCLHIFRLLPCRVGVIKTKMASGTSAFMLLSNAKVQANRLCVTNVQVAIRLGRKSRDRGFVLSGQKVSRDNLSDEILLGIGLLLLCHRLKRRYYATHAPLRHFHLDSCRQMKRSLAFGQSNCHPLYLYY